MLIIVSCIPLTSSAVEITEDNAEVFAPPEEYSNESWPDIQGYYNNSEHYLFAYFKDNNNCVFYCQNIDEYFDYASVEETDTTITISFDIPSGVSSPNWFVKYNWADGFRTNQIRTNTFDSAPIIYDIVNKTITWQSAVGSLINVPVLKFETDLIDSNSSPLDVTVSFSPALSGDVDRNVSSSGHSALLSTLEMTITNNSRFGIQYDFYIFLRDTDPLHLRPHSLDVDGKSLKSGDSIRYDDDPVFCFYRSESCYDNVALESNQLLNSPNLYNKGSCWHYLSSGQSETITFNWSQINLHEDVYYRAIVHAVRNDYGVVSNFWATDASDGDPDARYYQLDGDEVSVCYNDVFRMLQYKDIKYDYNDSSNGILPYNGENGIEDKQRYAFSYDTFTDIQTGETDYKSVNVYDDKNSWLNKIQPVYSSDSSDYSVSSRYNYLISYTSSVFYFVSSVYRFFPSDVSVVFNIGIWSIVILAIIRRLR